MLKLYTVPGACSLACDLVIEETGIAHEKKLVSFEKGDLNKPEFLKLNPQGAVPVLEIENGVGLTEGVAIMQYIADQKPESKLLPKDGMDRYRTIEWMNFIATELHQKTFMNLFMSETFVPDAKAREVFETHVHATLVERFDHIDRKLAGHDWCIGKTYTIADAYLFTVVNWSKHFDIDLKRWKNVNAHYSRVFERPATQRVLKAEGLI